MDEIFTDEKLDSIRFLRLLYRKRWILLVIAAISFGASVAVTMTIAPKFYSVGIVYPTYSNSNQQLLENPQFGYEVHADRLMQILESEVIRDSIIEIYDMVSYYELDTTSLAWEHNLHKMFTDDVTFFRSKYMSIVINATTKDPQLSADIVNSIIDMVDGIRENIFKENTFAAVQSTEEEYLEKERTINALVDSIENLQLAQLSTTQQHLYDQIRETQGRIGKARKDLGDLQKNYNFYDLPIEIDKASGTLVNLRSDLADQTGKRDFLASKHGDNDSTVVRISASVVGTESKITLFEDKLKGLRSAQDKYASLNDELRKSISQLNTLNGKYDEGASKAIPSGSSARLDRLTITLEHELERLNHLKQNYEEAYATYTQPFPKVYVIDRAKPSFKKASPSYSFNAFLGTSGGVLFAVLFFFFRDKYLRIKEQITK